MLLALCLFCMLRRKRRKQGQEQPAKKQKKEKPAKQPKAPGGPFLGFLGRGKGKNKPATETAFLEVPRDTESSSGSSVAESETALNPARSHVPSEQPTQNENPYRHKIQ